MKWVDLAFTRFAGKSADLTGRPLTFVIVLVLIGLWAVTGPYYHYSDTWQLVINTSTTIITCLIGFTIQGSANRSEAAIQAKLDELLDIDTKDHRKMIGIEHMTLNEIEQLRSQIEARVREKED
jgi:low affinity Fe/Cu permease